MRPAQRQTSTEPTASFAVGSVLSRAFLVFRQAPFFFCSLAALAVLPPALIKAFFINEAAWLSAIALEYICALMIQGAIAYGVYHALKKTQISFPHALARGLNRSVALLVASMLSLLGIILGMMFFIVPGFILLCAWEIVIPACVAEKLGPLQSLRRSAALTKGCRMRIFGILLTTQIAFSVLGKIGTAFLIALSEHAVAGLVLANVFAIVPDAYTAIISAVIYYDLRVIKEGADIDDLARVFD